MSISQSSNQPSGTNDLSFARQILTEKEVNDCLTKGKSYTIRLVQGCWIANHKDCYRAYLDILEYLRSQPEANHV